MTLLKFNAASRLHSGILFFFCFFLLLLWLKRPRFIKLAAVFTKGEGGGWGAGGFMTGVE